MQINRVVATNITLSQQLEMFLQLPYGSTGKSLVGFIWPSQCQLLGLLVSCSVIPMAASTLGCYLSSPGLPGACHHFGNCHCCSSCVSTVITFSWQHFPFVLADSFVLITHFISLTILPIVLTLLLAFVLYCCSIYGSHVCGASVTATVLYLSCIR